MTRRQKTEEEVKTTLGVATAGGVGKLAAQTLLGKLGRRLLEHPLTSGLDPDDPKTTELRKQILASKAFLRAIYDEWYSKLSAEVPAGVGAVLELGSGAGYCERFVPEVIKSELIKCSGVQIVADAQRMPFADATLRAILFANVLHHLPNVRQFLSEAVRCLKPEGKIAMIEPWVTPWSTLVNTRMHHEPFLPGATEWSFVSKGPLTGANGALAWIVFERDRAVFEREYPQFEIERIEPFLPLRYLLSGGVGMRSLMPGFTHGFWAGVERSLGRFQRRLAMFTLVVVRKKTSYTTITN
jgi:SAM-dependent methyltransferase